MLLEYWYYLIPSYLLAAVMWTMAGRFLLQFMVADPSKNYIMNAFVRITDPFYRLFGIITPGFLHPAFYPLYYGFLLFVLRLVLHAVFFSLGLTPTVTLPPAGG